MFETEKTVIYLKKKKKISDCNQVICFTWANIVISPTGQTHFSWRFALISLVLEVTHTERMMWIQNLTWLLGSFHLCGFRSLTESISSPSGRIEPSYDKPGPDQRDICLSIS